MLSIHTARLEQLQNKWEDHIEEIRNLMVTIDKLEEKNELFWRQRSRVKWLREGDSNSRFFHQTTIQRRRFNKIEKLQDGLGVWWEDEASIKRIVNDHFTNLLTTGVSTGVGVSD
ncbi:hypothetical protein ACFX1T_040300 [Malus domestica]